MQFVQVTRHGAPEVLRLAEQESSSLKPHLLRVNVHYSGINFADLLARMGTYPGTPKPPFIPGFEIGGVVSETGAEVDQDWIGKPVAGFTRFGGYATQCDVSPDTLFPIPSSDDLQSISAMPLMYLSAYIMLLHQANLRKDDWLLIHGIGGGVGLAAAQIADRVGARIIGTASTWKHPRLKKMGFDHLVDSRNERWVSQVRDITEDKGVDVIIDPIGGKHIRQSYDVLASLGRLVSFGFSAGAGARKQQWGKLLKAYLQTPRFHPVNMMRENKGIFGFHLGMLWDRADILRDGMRQLLTWYQEGHLSPIVDRVFNLKDAAAAHHYIAARKSFGKVMLRTTHTETGD